MALFDSAVFDSAVFDTGDAVAAPTVSQKRLWQFYRDKRDREEAAKVLDPAIEAISAPVLAKAEPVEADFDVLSDAPGRDAALADLRTQRATHELQLQAIAAAAEQMRIESEDEEAAQALLAWLMR